MLWCLQSLAGLPKEMVVAAHGNFDSARCIETGEIVPVEEVKQAIFSKEEDGVPGWLKLSQK